MTSTLRGMPKRFIITERCESGTYRERSVPIDGKYIPTHSSNARKAATSGHSAATPAEVPTAAAIPPEDLQKIKDGYYPGFLDPNEAKALFEYLKEAKPQLVMLRGKPVTTRPKVNYVIQNADGTSPLYKWGQHAVNYSSLQQAPPIIRDLIDKVTERFRIPPQEALNHAIATFYFNGKEQAIPCHQDKVFSILS